MAGRLTQLDIGETSGVDHPAHLSEGWMLMKSKDGAFASRVAELLKDSTTECPKCSSMMAKSDAYCPECGEKVGGTGDREDMAARKSRLRSLKKALDGLIEGGEMSEENEVTTTEVPVDDDELLKSVPDNVRALIVKEREERDKLAKALDAEHERRANEEALAKAASWKHIGVEPEEFAPVLAKLRGIDPESADAVEKVLDGAQAVAQASDAFRSFGKATGGEGGDAQVKLDSLAKVYASEHDVDMVEAQAAVLDTAEGERLYDEVRKAALKGE